MSGPDVKQAGIPASEAVFLGLVVLVVWFGEEGSEAGPGSSWFASSFMGVPLHYILLAGLVLLLLPYVAATPQFPLTKRLKDSGLWWWIVLCWGVVSLALAVAIVRGAPELFADWRNLAVTALVAVVASKWLANQHWKRTVVVDVAITLGLLSVPILVAYVAGSGSSVGGVRTTVFDGTTLYIASFSAIAGVWHLLAGEAGRGRWRLTLSGIATASSVLVVLLSLRRSFWVVLGVGMIVLLVVYMRSREVKAIRLYASMIAATLVVLGAFLTLGTETVIDRIESFNPDSQGRFSSTNQDHINDLADAWGVIAENPILGFGIGVRYETNLISEWKQDSFDVHNAILHAWLKFGLLGAIGYVGFHLAWARYALRERDKGLVAVGAFVVGFMVATMVGTWPYGRFQMSVFLGLLLAFTFVATSPDDEEVESESSLASRALR